MVFSSVSFLFLFLPITFAMHSVTKGRLRNYIILIASLVFYAWGEPIYILLMLFSSLVNYLFAFRLQQAGEKEKVSSEKVWLIITLVFNLGLLLFFKYSNFFVDSISSFTGLTIDFPVIALPIGISFYTFQTLSYMIDVYRREVRVQNNYADLLLYITFFPQLIAGPIVKYHDVDQQIIDRVVTWPKIQLGLRRFIIGLSKKVLIANQMAIIVDRLYAQNTWSFSSAWLVAICYLFQIYFDFSGYSDMAIGLGLLFGFRFRENFNYPYLADSIQDFWRRWHISLSTWFKLYLYIPLGGSRVPTRRLIFNYFVVFFCTGFWHGANWTFIVWGLWQWVFIMAEKYIFKTKTWWKPFRHIYTLFVVICGFVIFRADKLSQAWQVLSSMFMPFRSGTPALHYLMNDLLHPYAIFMFILAIFASGTILRKLKNSLPKYLLSLCFVLLWFFTVMSLSAATYNPFIYFRF